jgi:hypothetical protein
MALLILLGACFLWWCVYSLGRELAAEARNREETRIMEAWERAEEARAHQRRLAAIETARLNGIRELRRIAAEARGEVIESTAVEGSARYD